VRAAGIAPPKEPPGQGDTRQTIFPATSTMIPAGPRTQQSQ